MNSEDVEIKQYIRKTIDSVNTIFSACDVFINKWDKILFYTNLLAICDRLISGVVYNPGYIEFKISNDLQREIITLSDAIVQARGKLLTEDSSGSDNTNSFTSNDTMIAFFKYLFASDDELRIRNRHIKHLEGYIDELKAIPPTDKLDKILLEVDANATASSSLSFMNGAKFATKLIRSYLMGDE